MRIPDEYYIISDDRGDRYGVVKGGIGFYKRVREAMEFYGGDIETHEPISVERAFMVKVNGYEREFYLERTHIFM